MATRLLVCTLAQPVGAQIAAAPNLREQAFGILGTLKSASSAELQAPTVRLGQALFWDPRLSLDGRTACASCHIADEGGADARPRSPDARGELTHFNSMTVFNGQEATAGLRWLADRASGAEQAIGSLTGSMGFDAREDVLLLLQEYDYAPQFAQAFPDAAEPLSVANYGAALEAYQLTLRTPAPFDAWLAGDDTAMNELQLQGLDHFLDLGCAGCHNGPLLGGSSLQRFGVTDDYWHWTASAQHDTGLMEVTGAAADRNRFRVQPLRNVARTAPYFHDGSVTGLEQAVDVMARAQLGRELPAATLAALVAFLESLSGEVPAQFTAPPGVPPLSAAPEPAP